MTEVVLKAVDQGRTVHAPRAGVNDNELEEEWSSEGLSSAALLEWQIVHDCTPRQCSGDE